MSERMGYLWGALIIGESNLGAGAGGGRGGTHGGTTGGIIGGVWSSALPYNVGNSVVE